MKRLALVFFLIAMMLSANTTYAAWPSFGYESGSDESKQSAGRLIEVIAEKVVKPIEINSIEPAAGAYTITINEEDEGSYYKLRALLQADQGDVVTNEIATAWLDAKTLSIVQGDEVNQYTLTGEGIRFVLTLTFHEEEEKKEDIVDVPLDSTETPPTAGDDTSGKDNKCCCNLL